VTTSGYQNTAYLNQIDLMRLPENIAYQKEQYVVL
jgi:hypothetical protein